MNEHPGLQDSAVDGPVSPEAARLVAHILANLTSTDAAIALTSEYFLSEPRVETVAVALTGSAPEEEAAWTRLGGRAWVREWVRPGSSRVFLPAPGAGPDAALTMPWLSQRGREGLVVLTDRALLPAAAAQDREELSRTQVSSLVASTLSSRGEMFGSLSLVSTTAGPWPQQIIDDFRLLTAAITSRLALGQSDRAVALAIDAGTEAQAGYQQFFAAVGHELRTPLAAITGYTEVLLDDAAQTPVEPVAAAVLRDGKAILDAAEQLVTVVDSLLGAGRALASDDAREQVSVAAAIADVVHWHRAPALAAHVEMSVEDDAGLTVWAHATGVRQVLANLLGNAIAHHRTEGGTVRLSAQRLLGESGQQMVRIVVRDDGPGMEPDQLVHAFDPFVRFARRGTKGTGLGLSICRTIAERDGGAVRGVSACGEGSSFWLELPAEPVAGAPDPTT